MHPQTLFSHNVWKMTENSFFHILILYRFLPFLIPLSPCPYLLSFISKSLSLYSSSNVTNIRFSVFTIHNLLCL